MKKLTSVLAVLALSSSWALADQPVDIAGRNASAPGNDVTGFTAKNYPGVNPDTAKAAPNPNVVLKPRLGGVLVDGAKYGTEIISPAAPADWGIGEKYMSAPRMYGNDVQHESGPSANRESGGFKLFSLEF